MPLHNLENLLLHDRYQIGQRLLHGSYAEIYEALDTQTQRAVIVKALNPTLRGTPEAELEQMLHANFGQEAALLTLLQHKHIVQLFAQGTTASSSGVVCHYLVLEYLAGGSLYERCRRQPMTLAEVIYYFGPVCDALARAHAQGIIHRDLKPSNLLFTRDRAQLKLIDFGVAKQLKGQLQRDITRVGTEVYSPPEHNPNLPKNEEPLTPAADVYSLAKTIYTALAGRAPHEFRRRPINFLPERLAAQSWGPRLLQVLQRATAERVADRYASVSDFWAAFVALLETPPELRATDPLKRATEKTNRPTSPLAEVFKEALQVSARQLRQANRIVIELLRTPHNPTDSPASTLSWLDRRRFTQALFTLALLLLAWGATLLLQEMLSALLPLALANALALLLGLALAVMGTLAIGWLFKREQEASRCALPAGLPSTQRTFTVVQVDAAGRIVQRQQKQIACLLERLDDTLALEMVAIPGGSFQMGSSAKEAGHSAAEVPAHRVRVPGFWLSSFPITQAQWRVVAQWSPVSCALSAAPAVFRGESLPVENVTWHEAQEFCARLTQRTGRRYRLPSEAEWEYACRAGTQTPFHFGPTITPQLANYDGRLPYGAAPPDAARDRTTPSSATPYANDFGLLALHGNIWEWCADVWHGDYQGAPLDGSAWLEGGDNQLRVVRGGAWFNAAQLCRAAYRFAAPPQSKGNNCGFRVALDL